MGLFSSKKKTYVSSVVYNLAGEIAERPDYLKTLVSGNIISESQFSIGQTLSDGLLKGPGTNLKTYFSWAKANYGDIGVPTGSIGEHVKIDVDVISGQLPHDPENTVMVQDCATGPGEFSWWSEQWMFEHYPELIGSEWFSDIDETTNEITIDFEGGGSASFMPADYDKDSLYIYVTYNEVAGSDQSAVETGDVISLGSGGAFPSTSGWTTISSSNSDQTLTLQDSVRTVVTYSDARPGSDTTTVSNTDQVFAEIHSSYQKSEYQGEFPDSEYTWSLISTMYLDQVATIDSDVSETTSNEDIGGGVTKTTTVTTTTQSLVLARSYRVDTQDQIHKAWSDTRMFIYKMGSGNTVLDALLSTGSTSEPQYLPFIPIRLDNKFLSESYEPEGYALASKAYKKLTGRKFSELIDKIADNESIDDIDFAYVMSGVPLNTQSKVGKKYLYYFFRNLMLDQRADTIQSGLNETEQAEYNESYGSWIEWKNAQREEESPLFGALEPFFPDFRGPNPNRVKIKSEGTLDTNVDMSVEWSSIEEFIGSGPAKTGARKGELWVELGAPAVGVDKEIKNLGAVMTNKEYSNRPITIIWQDTESSWRSLLITGLKHTNTIYNNKSVVTLSGEAMEDEDESGFLIPLHFNTLKQMSFVDMTQLSTESQFLVFNCYKVKKKKWYQTGIFKIIVAVVTIAVMIAFPPIGGAAVGAWASVGAAVGLTGLVAIIAGAVISMVAAMIITKMIGIVAVEVLGEKWGAIVGAVAGFVATSWAMGGLNGQSMATMISNMGSAQNLIALTNAVGTGIQGYIRASVMDIAGDFEEISEEFSTKSKEISELYAENIGYGRAFYDPMGLTDTFGNSMEPPESFLGRTLMTGTDIADLSLNLISNFAEITTSTELPGV